MLCLAWLGVPKLVECRGTNSWASRRHRKYQKLRQCYVVFRNSTELKFLPLTRYSLTLFPLVQANQRLYKFFYFCTGSSTGYFRIKKSSHLEASSRWLFKLFTSGQTRSGGLVRKCLHSFKSSCYLPTRLEAMSTKVRSIDENKRILFCYLFFLILLTTAAILRHVVWPSGCIGGCFRRKCLRLTANFFCLAMPCANLRILCRILKNKRIFR